MENKIHVPNRQPAVYVLSVCVNLVFRTMGDITKISGCSNMLTSSKVPNSLAAECNPLRFPTKSVFKQLGKNIYSRSMMIYDYSDRSMISL